MPRVFVVLSTNKDGTEHEHPGRATALTMLCNTCVNCCQSTYPSGPFKLSAAQPPTAASLHFSDRRKPALGGHTNPVTPESCLNDSRSMAVPQKCTPIKGHPPPALQANDSVSQMPKVPAGMRNASSLSKWRESQPFYMARWCAVLKTKLISSPFCYPSHPSAVYPYI